MLTNILIEIIKTVLPKKHPKVNNNKFNWFIKIKEIKITNILFAIIDKKEINNTW